MAEAVVEERPSARFYCHVCNVEFRNDSNSFTCPHCSDGFIEELQDPGDTGAQSLDASGGPEWLDARIDDDTDEFLAARFGGRSENGGPMEGRYNNLRTLTRLAASNLRQQMPIESLVQDFIVNLGVGVNWGGPGNVQLFLGNPGDYAWGREGLDAIVTQLLNQMDSTGPPPVPRAVIDALQVVEVTEEQVAQNMQCSICWDQFQLKEQVRQLPCLHIYHENCIRPWLELHGTCPICRQNLGQGEGGNAAQNGDGAFNPSGSSPSSIDTDGGTNHSSSSSTAHSGSTDRSSSSDSNNSGQGRRFYTLDSMDIGPGYDFGRFFRSTQNGDDAMM